MPAIKPPMRVFIATVADGERVDGTDVRAPRARRIEAAYYQDENGFTTFKDADNKQVFSARNDILLTVERVPGNDGVCGVAGCACAGPRSANDERDRHDLPLLSESEG